MKKIETIYKKIGKELKLCREQYGHTQVQLAKQMKISRPSLANIEAGRQRIYLHQIMAAQKALELPKNYLLRFIIETNGV